VFINHSFFINPAPSNGVSMKFAALLATTALFAPAFAAPAHDAFNLTSWDIVEALEVDFSTDNAPRTNSCKVLYNSIIQDLSVFRTHLPTSPRSYPQSSSGCYVSWSRDVEEGQVVPAWLAPFVFRCAYFDVDSSQTCVFHNVAAFSGGSVCVSGSPDGCSD
jgi:hypothetical protein